MLKFAKSVFIFILVSALVVTGISVVKAQHYDDVLRYALLREEFDSIMYVSDNGIMVGYETGEFAPNAYINRAQFVQTLYNHSGEFYSAYESIFTDVIEGTWYYDAVYWAYNEGLINGISDTTFHPARNITTAEALTILYRYAENEFYDTEYSFETEPILSHSDHNSIAPWARDSMNWALAYNILNPLSDTAALNPNADAKRKEIAVFMRNFEKEAIGVNNNNSNFAPLILQKSLEFSNL